MSKIIIIGGGASGLFAAVNAAKSGNEVTIIDANDKMGKKLLVTGNGRCNISNLNDLKGKYHCSNENFLKTVFEQFSNKDIMNEFAKMGLMIKDKSGYLYPMSMQASSVVELLISYCRLLGVKLVNNTVVYKVEIIENGFYVYTSCFGDNSQENNHTYLCSDIIVATGTKAGLKENICENLVSFLKSKGHTIEKYKPALCSLFVNENSKYIKRFFKNVNGVRCNINAYLLIDNVREESSSGELQLTDYGLSGIVIFQLSGAVSRALEENKNVEIMIDFLPENDTDEVAKKIFSQDFYEKKSLSDIMTGIINSKLSNEIINLYTERVDNTIKPFLKNLPEDKIIEIVNFIKNVRFSINKTNDYLHSQICCGGISVDEINPNTMESKRINNLYFTGECINVDGECGGYNLQWAWSTGYIAGKSCGNGEMS